MDRINSILTQPFSYLDKGSQSYVFLSKDQKHVLKVFRFDFCKVPMGKAIVRTVRKWAGLREKQFFPEKPKIMKNFSACKLAYSIVRDQTGVEFVHLNPRECDLPVITVRDRLKRLHKIDPANCRFALQKRIGRFDQIQETKDPGPMIDSFLSLLSELAEKGLVNLDVKLEKNFGFLDGKAYLIDFGNLVYNPECSIPQKERFARKITFRDKTLKKLR
ncbi:MAG: hypothetical protein K1X28_04515 [Parachlamydiales bacterium]|nr:hypothetical protein [Parachlamydiales bacterium]